MTRRSVRRPSTAHVAAAVLAFCFASAAAAPIVLPFSRHLPWWMIAGEGAVAVIAAAVGWGAAGRRRGWAARVWALGFASLPWGLVWILAALHLRNAAVKTLFVPGAFWAWTRWGVSTGVVAGIMMMAVALRARGRR